MKKRASLCLMIVALFCVWVAPGLFAPAPAAARSVTLTYSNFFPPTHIQSQLAEKWCQEVEKRTQGRVKVQYFAGGTLTKPHQAYDGVLDGISDIALSAFAYTRGRFPTMAIIDMPLGYPTGVAATAVANTVYAQYKPKELDSTQVMYLHAHGPGIIHTRSKPIRTLEDLRGVTIRSTGFSAEMVKALGATPVAMPMPESYQSLQRGVVDGSAHPVEANLGWKLGEVVGYATMAYSVGYTTAFFVVMNKAKWNSLDAGDREIIDAINAEWAVKHGEAWDSSDTQGLRDFFQNGNSAVGLDSREAARWEAAVAPMIDAYAEKLDQDGMNGTTILNTIRETLKKFD
jgi:TRAP-type transport system periplasmic protein